MKNIIFEDSEIKPIKVIKTVRSDDLVNLEIEKKVFKALDNIEEPYYPELSMWYGDSPDLNFKIENLFSELTDDFLRAKARINLGIAGEYALEWGNIKGNIVNQEDLVKFVKDTITLEEGDFLKQLAELLKIWSLEINAKLASKADIESPTFQGIPTVPTPTNTNYSKLIANTLWVEDKINEYINRVVKHFYITPEWAFITNKPCSVTVSWDFNEPIVSLSINGESLDISTRTKLYILNEDTDFTLNYITKSGEAGKRTISFQFKAPIYIGTSLSELTMTALDVFSINCSIDKYAYVMVPFPNVEFSVNNLIGGFILQDAPVLNGLQYFTYRSYNKGLGNIKINLLYGK